MWTGRPCLFLCIIMALTCRDSLIASSDNARLSPFAFAVLEEPEPRDGRADALIAALEIYDGSVRSLEWHTAVYQPLKDGTWSRTCIRRAGISERGDWYTRADHPWWDEEGDSGVLRVWRFQRANDERMFAADASVLEGKVAYNDDDMLCVTSPFHLMGRYCDFERQSRLHEVFARAVSIQYAPPSEDEPWPMVSCIVSLSGTLMRLEVRVDAEHGYAPRMIRTYRNDINVPIEWLETIAYTHVEGAWVPQLGLRTLYSITSTVHTPMALERFQNAEPARQRSRELAGVAGGVPEALRPVLRAAVARHQLFGILESNKTLFYSTMAASSVAGTHMPELMIAKILSANSDIPEYQFTLPVPSSRTLYDFFRDKRLPVDQTLPMPRLVAPPDEPVASVPERSNRGPIEVRP